MSSRWKPHVTVAAVIERLDHGAPQYLMVEEHTPEGLLLNNPAGHLEPGESPAEGAAREALEETAFAFTPEYLVGIYIARSQRSGEDVTYLRLAFGGRAQAPEPGRALDAGIVRTLWMTLDELRGCRERHRSPLLLRCIEDHAAGRRYPLELITADASLYEAGA